MILDPFLEKIKLFQYLLNVAVCSSLAQAQKRVCAAEKIWKIMNRELKIS